MKANNFRALAPLFSIGRPKGVDPLLYSFVRLGRVTKSASYYAKTTVERERDRTQRALELLEMLHETVDSEIISTTEMKIPGHYGDISLELYSVPEPEELIVYFHGGGWVLGSIATADRICKHLSVALNASIISVEYHLAPEYPFPSGLEDAISAILWAVSMAPGLGVISGNVTAAGTSAGANLATAACLKIRDEGGVLPSRQLLHYPVTDVASFDTESYKRYGRKKLGLSQAQMDWFRKRYLMGADDYANPYISVNRAKDLSSLPPAMIVTAECDILRSEAETYGKLLAEAGVAVETITASGMTHGFLNFVGIIDSATAWFTRIAKAYIGFRDRTRGVV